MIFAVAIWAVCILVNWFIIMHSSYKMTFYKAIADGDKLILGTGFFLSVIMAPLALMNFVIRALWLGVRRAFRPLADKAKREVAVRQKVKEEEAERAKLRDEIMKEVLAPLDPPLMKHEERLPEGIPSMMGDTHVVKQGPKQSALKAAIHKETASYIDGLAKQAIAETRQYGPNFGIRLPTLYDERYVPREQLPIGEYPQEEGLTKQLIDAKISLSAQEKIIQDLAEKMESQEKRIRELMVPAVGSYPGAR